MNGCRLNLVSVCAGGTLLVLIAIGSAAGAAKVGDCDDLNGVAIHEVVACVNRFLENETVTCANCDQDQDGHVQINEVVGAVNCFLENDACPMVQDPQCGNALVEGSETCDDGGTCLNGPDAGMRCPASVENGVDCGIPGFCRPSGGDGCAENCTLETVGQFPLGASMPTQSRGVIQGQFSTLDFTLSGRLTARAGKPRFESVRTTAGKVFNPGDLPVVLAVDDNHYSPQDPQRGIPPVPVVLGGPASPIACACVRGFAVKSCGGTPGGLDCSPKCVDSEGMRQCAGGGNALLACSSDVDCPAGVCGQICDPTLGNSQCATGYSCTAQDDLCTPDEACDFVHGPGNYASGVVSCGTNTEGNDYLATLDSLSGERTTLFTGAPAPLGSAVILTSTSTAAINASSCDFNTSFLLHGPDGLPCTDDDPDKSSVMTFPLTTGTATGRLINANDSEGATIEAGVRCGALDCEVEATGNPFDCDTLTQEPPVAGGAALAGVFAAESVDPAGDVVVSTLFRLFGEIPQEATAP